MFTLHSCLSTMIDPTSYNLVFLPWVRNKDKNAGFAFVNFLSSEHAAQALAALSGRIWPDVREKEIHIRPAVVQGFEANMNEHLRTLTRWQSLLLLHNGERVSEEEALSLYTSRAFKENFMLQVRLMKEAETEDIWRPVEEHAAAA